MKRKTNSDFSEASANAPAMRSSFFPFATQRGQRRMPRIRGVRRCPHFGDCSHAGRRSVSGAIGQIGVSLSAGFTLVEMLVVVAVIALLAGILIPSIGAAQKSARKRKAELECNAIKVAVEQFFSDFKYMPWGDPDDPKARVGEDMATREPKEHEDVMKLLRGDNKLRKSYLEISSRDTKSSSGDEEENTFYDPWKNYYRIYMDRNLDQQVDYTYGGSKKTYKARVLVLSCGPDGVEDNEDDIRTFDIID